MPFHVPVFAAVAENPFLARSPWRTPRFHPKRKAEQPCRPLPCVSSRFPSVPPCPSTETYVAASVSFHALGLSPFSRPWPNRCFRPARHGEPLVFSPDARPNSHAARRLAPPCRFPSVPPCPSPKTYILPSVSFHTLGLSLFPGPCPNLGFRPVRHGRTPRFRPKRKAEQPCRPVAILPFTQGIRSSFGVFPHAGTWLFFGRARTHGGLRPLPTLRLGRFRSEDRCPSPVCSKPSR